jgi:uncharacterized membrane protein YesL
MFEALRVVGRAFGLWWRELLLLTVFNLAWLALQVPIITGPPATAAMYVLARRLADGELIEFRHGWQALRQMLWPAWQWGALNLVIVVAVVGNFRFYSSTPGLLWSALRLAWGIIATLWFAVNLFYWPFWLAETDRRLGLTLRNGLLLFLKTPGLGLTILVICTLLIVVSVLLTLPLAVGLMAWLALIGVAGVDAALHSTQTAGPDTGVEMEPL